jgi:DNA-binding response OmpR family regulator
MDVTTAVNQWPATPPRLEGGTLLAVVPVPGTGTSLAIVSYTVTTPVTTSDGPAAPGEQRTGILLDRDRCSAWVGGTEVRLTSREFGLLAYLTEHPSTMVSRADLAREVWHRDLPADSRTVDVHISRLRRKLGPEYGKCLVTDYRIGYTFQPIPVTSDPH